MRRRTCSGAISAGAAGVLAGGLPKLLAAASTHLRSATAGQASSGGETFLLGGDLLVQPARVWGDAIDGRGDLGLAFGEGASLNSYMVGLSLLRNRGLAAKDILLDLAGGCFWQL
jgi:hypothetical protein